jgi:hypothetical protein
MYFSLSNQGSGKRNDYFVSHHLKQTPAINLLYVGFKLQTKSFRLNAISGAGTYMQQNYSHEPVFFRNIVEANAGFKILNKWNIWFDAGVFASPIGDENCFTFLQPTLSRSIVSEYTPYYLNGIKLGLQPHAKLNISTYVVNGWQQISDVNNQKSALGHILYEPNKNTSYNYVFYYGNHTSAAQMQLTNRTMHNVYFTGMYKKSQIMANGVFIHQSNMQNQASLIYAANIKYKYNLLTNHFVNGRIEYYNDEQGVDVAVLNGNSGFNVTGFSIGYDYAFCKSLLARSELRHLQSSKQVFNNQNTPAFHATILYAGLSWKW